jgi:hypothetical protein
MYCVAAVGASGASGVSGAVGASVAGDASQQQQQQERVDTVRADTVRALRKRPVAAAFETLGINAGVWAFDRFALNADYAQISLGTMKRNLRHSLVWDNDMFLTNLFLHPYQGGMYYNAARTNGMNEGASWLYAVAGSLSWEYLFECELPSLNDFISTPIGGFALGEMSYRLANVLTDSRTTGWERFGREFLGAVVNPVNGLTRIISGEAWKTRPYSGKTIANQPVHFAVTAGYRGLSESREIRIDNAAYMDLRLLYGNVFFAENEHPYDAFILSTTLNLFSYQPLMSSFNLVGEIWGRNVPLRNEHLDFHWGVFQHFDYYDSKTIDGQPHTNTYRISEVAAFGLGEQFRYSLSDKTFIVSSAFLNAVLLGGSVTDYYNVEGRDYNLSSGFSSKLNIGFIFNEKASLTAIAENYRLFTMNRDDGVSDASPTSENLRGDEGNVMYSVIKLNFNYFFTHNYYLAFSSSAYLRDSRYDAHPNVHTRILDSRLGFGYLF